MAFFTRSKSITIADDEELSDDWEELERRTPDGRSSKVSYERGLVVECKNPCIPDKMDGISIDGNNDDVYEYVVDRALGVQV